MKRNKLTPLQTRFCEEYLIDFSPTRAAKRAGFTNPVYGRELVAKTHIKTAINRIQHQASRQTGVTISFVIGQLAETYYDAKEKGDLSTATRVLELLGKHVGAFSKDYESKGSKVVVVQNFGFNPAVKDLPPGSELLEAIELTHSESQETEDHQDPGGRE